jgi:two-component system, LytTR family, sensor kinase
MTKERNRNSVYYFNENQLQKIAFFFAFPVVNWIFLSASLIEIGEMNVNHIFTAGIKTWFFFALSYFIIRLIEKYFSTKLKLRQLWRKLVLYSLVVMAVSILFAPMIEFNTQLPMPRSVVGPRLIILIEVILYLCIVYIINQQMRVFETSLILKETELNRLRAQSNPHFLFNTLNMINAEISQDPQNAKEMVYDLSDLLRKNIRMAQKGHSTLTEELHLVTLYLTLQQKRFKDRLTFEIRETNETKSFRVPALILQPVIENAVKHAVAPYASKAHITVETYPSDESVIIEIRDTGPVFRDKDVVEGDGLRILRQTLDLQYDGSYNMMLESTSSGGLFTLRLPLTN